MRRQELGEGECGDDVAGLLVRERQSSEFGYFACEKEAKRLQVVKCQEKWLVAVKRIDCLPKTFGVIGG